MLGTSGGLFFPLFRLLGLQIVVNVDGEEWNRSKWGFFARIFLRLSDYIAIKTASYVICDHPRIFSRVLDSGVDRANISHIPYGCDHISLPSSAVQEDVLLKYSLLKNSYFFKVCRIEPENNIDLVLRAFSQPGMPDLCIVGNWSNSHGRSLLANYQSFDNMLLLNSIYKPSIINSLRANCRAYIHDILLEVRTLL